VGIVEEDIAKVRAATDFVAIAGEHLALRRVGTRWVALCPFHAEKSPSFNLNAELGFYYCFGCGAKGDAITFLRELDHLDFVEAVEKLASRAGIALRYDDAATGRDHQRRSRIHETLERAVEWYHQRLLTGADAATARAYLRRERGYDGDVVRRYLLGWAPEGWDQLVRSIGLPPGALVDAGLAYVNDAGRHTDFFRGRLLFPIFEPSGRPVGAGGRVLPGGRGPKYKNTAATTVYDKGRVLYGLNWAKSAVVASGQVVVCEGYTDVIGLHGAGVGEAVATCGTALADGHIRLLTNFARRIVLAYDADAAGQAAAERYYEWERRFEVDIRVAALPGGADPADLARSDPDALRSAVAGARPYLEFRLDRLFERADLASAEGRVRAATDAMALVTSHPNELVRDQYLMAVADRCRIEPARLRSLPVPPTPATGQGERGRGRLGSPAVPGAAWRGGEADRTGGAGWPMGPDRPPLGGPELEALRLAVHRPAEVAERLEVVLFAHPLALAAYVALAGATTLHQAIDDADPQAADLLQRLAVEDTVEDVDDVMTRLVERAGQRSVDELQAEARVADSSDQPSYVATVAWLKLALETLRDSGPADGTAERRLVEWMVSRQTADRSQGDQV